MKPEWDDVELFIADNLKSFRPFACFDKQLDCVRVVFHDCSVTDIRKNPFITVLKPNSGSLSETGCNAGFTIKGIAYLCNEANIPLKAGLLLVDLLNGIVKVFPDSASKGLIEEFLPRITGMRICFDENLATV